MATSPEKTTGMAAGRSVVLANNDVIYLWWSVPQKIKNCLGFSIHRVVGGKTEPQGLMATVGFDFKADKRKSPQTTDQWPIQSFNWKDVYAPHNVSIKYKIIPMTGTWDNLKPDTKNTITTDAVQRTQQFKSGKVIFNRGLLSTQAFAKSGSGKAVTRNEAQKMITDPASKWRQRLGGQMLDNVHEFFGRAEKGGGKYYCALYELTDEQLISELLRNKDTELILSNANSSKVEDGKTVSVNDGTNEATRKMLHTKMKQGKFKIYDRMLGTHIGHNKFVIYVDKKNVPKAVLTGSTNWTPTGLCGQTNNMIILDSADVAKQYMEYWNMLKADTKQAAPLRTWCAGNSKIIKLSKPGNINLRYSPNTKQQNKPAKNAAMPVDIKTVFALIAKAKSSVLFLVFNPGSPSILDQMMAVASKRPKGKPLFVRGAISDAQTSKKVRTAIFSNDILKAPDVYEVTGVAAIPGTFSYWEQELLKIGFATIHDKIMVIDPFDKDCVVVTGSHNLGYTASYKNDENMLIIQNDLPMAQAYAAHVLDIVNHFKWRYKLQSKLGTAKTPAAKTAALNDAWHDLNEKDSWMDYYFDKKGFVNHDKMFEV